MNRAGTIFKFLRLSSSVLSTRLSTTRSLSTQVTHFSPFSLRSLSNQSHNTTTYRFNTHQKLYFSSKPHSIVELLSTNDWSAELENELESLSPSWTHETVIYVLKKLDKDPQKAWDFFNWVSERNGFRPSSLLYSLVLRIVISKDSMKKFWITIKKMKEQGFYIDEETYLTILGICKKEKMAPDAAALTHFYDRMIHENAKDNSVKDAVRVILERQWNKDVENKLLGMKTVLTDNFVIRVLKELRSYPVKALSFFNWVGRHEGYQHNSVTYNALVRVLGRDDSIREFWGAVDEMKKAGYEMDIDTYIKISRQFQKIKLMEDAVRLYEFMMDGQFKPSIQDCSVLLRSISASDNPDLDLVSRVAGRYEATGNSLSKSVYDGMHRSFTSAGKFDEAEQIVQAMRDAGYEPDNITYSQLVFGLCKAKRLEEACKVLDEMEAGGCIPDIMTWTILIQGHFAANQVDEGLLCLAKMTEKNTTPDADLLHVLVKGFLSQKRIDGAYTFFMEMVNEIGLVPWQATCKLVIENLLQVRKLEEAMDLLRLMKKHDYPPFPEPFDQYISKFGTVEDAVNFFKVLSMKEYPSSFAYLRILESFLKEGRYSEARDLLFRCPHHIRKDPKISKLFGSAKTGDNTV
ncbi:unnamed protein product [Dovyalis caffra]|uniref:Pentatricopeptide repeat-containing protein n=1 Tax=Dovyalis caffra TaxID=77055 RepID=A0AAV1STD5_9ROSI|nr:unnamed protein product [Dovyalis caffra]